jgi:hypothetical protein
MKQILFIFGLITLCPLAQAQSSDACLVTRAEAYEMAAANPNGHVDVEAEAEEIYASMQEQCKQDQAADDECVPNEFSEKTDPKQSAYLPN